jgi:hypothetical protein
MVSDAAGSAAASRDWRRELDARLPPEREVRERNAAITATYASWYRRHPSLFKWAGVAAFASRQVGLALAPFRSTEILDELKDELLERLGIERHDDLALSHELDLIRQTNNLVFADIGWAHAAFIEGGGLAAVEAGLASQSRHGLMLEGFREIESGRVMLLDPAADHTAAQNRIWRGNELLLQHEQSVTVQDQFAKFNRPFTILLDVVTSLDFGAGELLAAARTAASFAAFMASHGRLAADVTHMADRWYWVKNEVLPLWRLLDSSDPDLPQRVDRLIAAGTPV